MSPKIEVPTGAINDTNRLFRVSVDYLPGSTRVFLNGALLRRDLTDGWVELGGTRIQLNEAPLTTDVLQVYYLPLA